MSSDLHLSPDQAKAIREQVVLAAGRSMTERGASADNAMQQASQTKQGLVAKASDGAEPDDLSLPNKAEPPAQGRACQGQDELDIKLDPDDKGLDPPPPVKQDQTAQLEGLVPGKLRRERGIRIVTGDKQEPQANVNQDLGLEDVDIDGLNQALPRADIVGDRTCKSSWTRCRPRTKAISVNKQTAWLVFSPACFVAATRT